MKGLFQCPPWARSFWAFSPYLNHMRNFSNVKGLDCEIFTKFLFSGTAPDSYKQKTSATRLYLPDYGCKGTKIFLYLPSTYYVRVLVLSFSEGGSYSRNFLVFF